MMIELTSTPIILMVILGVAGMIIPVINVVRKERGSSTFYGVIAFGALLLALGFVIFQFYDENLAPAAMFSEDPPMEYRDPDPTSVNVDLRSEYAPLKL